MPFKPFVSTNELRMRKYLMAESFYSCSNAVRIHFPTRYAMSYEATAASTLMIICLINDLHHNDDDCDLHKNNILSFP